MSDERVIVLANNAVLSSAIVAMRGLPTDGSMELAIRKARKVRTEPQNRRMWGAILRDIARQAWVQGRQFSEDTWHYYIKCEFLPEGDEPNITELVKDPANWQKWELMPDGDRRCIGSTTKLTKRGMVQYQERVEAYATQELGVMFSADARFEQ